MENEDLIRYPIGSFVPRERSTSEEREQDRFELNAIVPRLQQVVDDLPVSRLHMPYRPNGWTPQQIIHHMADNDMNAFIRLKRGITETEPQASSYRQDLWAELNDYKETPVSVSIQLLQAIHFRMDKVLESLTEADYEKKLKTNVLGSITVDTAIQRFIWHNHHHTAQIRSVCEAE